LRAQLTAAGFKVFQVNAKRCHDAALVLDGVPSSHDRKSAVLIGWLHARGISREWRVPTDSERAARAALARRELYADPLARNRGRIEALVARHWPELSRHLDLDSTSLLTLLVTYRSPRNTHAEHDAAVALLHKAGRGTLSETKVLAVVTSAGTTVGAPMTGDEELLVHELANQSLDLRKNMRRVDEEIASLARSDVAMQRLAAALGSTSAAAIVAHLGDPASYESPAAFVKAAGLNLRERSSGKHVGQLKLTKRGPARVRFYLYFAALRLARSDPAARAWYKRRRGYTEENRMRAIVAVMRKLASALPHVARGAPFDSAKLFDARRLDLAEVAAPKGASPVELEVNP
jgi:transposase